MIEDLLARVARLENALFAQESRSDAMERLLVTSATVNIKSDNNLDQQIHTPAVTTNLSYQVSLLDKHFFLSTATTVLGSLLTPRPSFLMPVGSWRTCQTTLVWPSFGQTYKLYT